MTRKQQFLDTKYFGKDIFFWSDTIIGIGIVAMIYGIVYVDVIFLILAGLEFLSCICLMFMIKLNRYADSRGWE